MGIPAIDKALGLPVDVPDQTPARSGALASCLPCTSVFEFFLLIYMPLARMWLAMVASFLSFLAPCYGCCGNLTVGGLRNIIYLMVVATVLRILLRNARTECVELPQPHSSAPPPTALSARRPPCPAPRPRALSRDTNPADVGDTTTMPVDVSIQSHSAASFQLEVTR